jgi:adenylate kinase
MLAKRVDHKKIEKMERIKTFEDFTLNERELPDNQGKILVILGAPGSGKGTLSKELKKNYNFIHLSTGDIIRNSDDEDVKKIIEAGNLLPDNMMIKILRRELKKVDLSSNVILDGFPRTIKQAKRLDSLLGRMGLGLNHALYLDLPDKVAKERIKKRAMEEDRKDDASDEVVEKRFKEYHEKTFPLLDFYQKSRKLIKLEADKGKDKVLEQVKERLGLKSKK